MCGGQRAIPTVEGRYFFVGASLLAICGGQRAMPQAKYRWLASSVAGQGLGVKNGQAQHLQFLGFWVLGYRHLIELDTVNAKTRPLFVAAASPHAGVAACERQRACQCVCTLDRAAMNIAKPFLPPTLFPEGAGGLRPAGADSAGRPGAAPPAAAAPAAAQAFSAVLEQSQPSATPRTSAAAQVKSGDTLIGIVREQAARRGLGLSGSQSMRGLPIPRRTQQDIKGSTMSSCRGIWSDL